MNLYQWLLVVFNWASNSNTSHFVYESKATDGLCEFLELAATQYARKRYWLQDFKPISRKRLDFETEYFACALTHLLLDYSPEYCDLTLRLRYTGMPWEDLTVDGHEWKYGPEDYDKTIVNYHEIPWDIEYMGWDAWLGMTVGHEFFELPAATILAEVVWEMTFVGIPGTRAYAKRRKWLDDGPSGACDTAEKAKACTKAN